MDFESHLTETGLKLLLEYLGKGLSPDLFMFFVVWCDRQRKDPFEVLKDPDDLRGFLRTARRLKQAPGN